MGENQGPGDILPPASAADDQQLKLQALQEEVDLLKASIKRLLMDIRERMNNLENPFVHDPESIRREDGDRPSKNADPIWRKPDPIEQKSAENENAEEYARSPKGRPPSDRLISALKDQLTARETSREERNPEKLRLTKVHQIFEWTSLMVKRYGHDRLDLMLQSYRAMGYLTRESSEQIREISKLMPASLGESHEIRPDEFIKQLYTLNRVLDPSDTTLDRDMIQVLMEQQQRNGVSRSSDPVAEKGESSLEDWVDLKDGV